MAMGLSVLLINLFVNKCSQENAKLSVTLCCELSIHCQALQLCIPVSLRDTG
jgi:hypothetical protein